MPLHDALKDAPFFLQRRYGSIRGYVKAVLETEYSHVNFRAVPAEDIEFIQLVAFVFLLHSFLDDGHKAAARAVKIFKELGVKAFSIGNTTFSANSDSVMLGKRLAADLLTNIEDKALQKLIVSSDSVGILVRELFEGLGHG